MKQLYVGYLGFNSKERCAEDHEVLFILSDKWIDDVKKQLKKQTTLPLGVHLDLLIKVEIVDWYDILFKKWAKNKEDKKLYFWYMWWESQDRYIEDHEMCFTVQDDVVRAKAALKNKTVMEVEVHVDFIKEISQIWEYWLVLEKSEWENIKKVQWYSVL